MVFRSVLAWTLLMLGPVVFADDAEEVMVGQAAPDFTVTGIDGKQFSLSDKLKAGDRHIVLLFSRASW